MFSNVSEFSWSGLYSLLTKSAPNTVKIVVFVSGDTDGTKNELIAVRTFRIIFHTLWIDSFLIYAGQ